MASTPAPSSTRPSQPPSGVVRAVESLDHDSGVIDLALAQAADPQAAQRATATPLAAAGLFDEDPASERGSQPPPVSQRISVPPASSGARSGSMPIAAASQPSVAARDATPAHVVVPGKDEGEKKRGGLVVLLGGLIAASAVAAGAFFFVQHSKSNTPVASVAAPVTQPEVVVPPPAAPILIAQNDTPAADSVDPSAVLAPTATAMPKGAAGGAMKKSAAKTAATSPKVEAPAQPPADAVDPKLVAKDLPPSPTEPTGTLADHMKQAAGPTAAVNGDPQAAGGPQFAAGSVPQRPSQGAVTGALGAALSGARACLAPDAAVSQATITFGSAGAVSSVAVTGSAAGKPAEACIKAALGKAKVPPFAQPSYTAKVTVRPN